MNHNKNIPSFNKYYLFCIYRYYTKMADPDHSRSLNVRDTQLTQQINQLLEQDPLVERRLLYLSQAQHFENLDDILNQQEPEEFYSMYLE